VDPDIGRAVEIPRIETSLALPGTADLHHELASLRKFQHLTGVAALASEPDVAVMIEKNAVFTGWPFVTLSWSAPTLNEVPIPTDLQPRRRGGLIRPWLRRPKTVLNPDMILSVNVYVGHQSQRPLGGQFRPGGIDLENRHFTHRRLARLRSRRFCFSLRIRAADADHRQQRSA